MLFLQTCGYRIFRNLPHMAWKMSLIKSCPDGVFTMTFGRGPSLIKITSKKDIARETNSPLWLILCGVTIYTSVVLSHRPVPFQKRIQTNRQTRGWCIRHQRGGWIFRKHPKRVLILHSCASTPRGSGFQLSLIWGSRCPIPLYDLSDVPELSRC